jgi:hypothetical protein
MERGLPLVQISRSGRRRPAGGRRASRRAAVDIRTLDLFVGGVLGGSVGVLLLGMTSTLVLGRGFDAAGLILGALTGLAFKTRYNSL